MRGKINAVLNTLESARAMLQQPGMNFESIKRRINDAIEQLLEIRNKLNGGPD
jgi:hypothetical protein